MTLSDMLNCGCDNLMNYISAHNRTCHGLVTGYEPSQHVEMIPIP